jgi:cysteinyl-tRNA synthetase
MEKYSVVQIRIMFLNHNWDSTLDFKESSLQEAKDFETRLNNFFAIVKAELNRMDQQPPEFTGRNDFRPTDKALSDL